MEILDVLTFGTLATGYGSRGNLVYSQRTSPTLWVPAFPFAEPRIPVLLGIDISDPSNMSKRTEIVNGEDPTSSATDKTIYNQGDYAVSYDSGSEIIVVGSGALTVFDLATETFNRGRKYNHPDSLVMRLKQAVVASNGNTLLGAGDQMDVVTHYWPTAVQMTRFGSFTTWADASIYGVSNLTIDSSGPNYLNGAAGIMVAAGGSNLASIVVSALTGYVTRIIWTWNGVTYIPSIQGTPLELAGGGLNSGATLLRPFRGKYGLIPGGRYTMDDPPTIYLVDSSPISGPTLVSEYTHPDMTGSYFNDVAVFKESIVLAPMNGSNPGLLAIDYSDPANPVTLDFLSDSRFDELGSAYDSNITVVGDVAYIRSWHTETVVDPEDPEFIYDEEFLKIISVDISSLYGGGTSSTTSTTSWAIGLDMTQIRTEGEVT